MIVVSHPSNGSQTTRDTDKLQRLRERLSKARTLRAWPYHRGQTLMKQVQSLLHSFSKDFPKILFRISFDKGEKYEIFGLMGRKLLEIEVD